MKERWGRSWYIWVGIILEILGKKGIGDSSSIYPFFAAGVVAAFELYVLLQLPYSEKLLLYEESANNPKCVQIRWIGLLPILAASYFARTTIWYFWIYFPLTEAASLYFAGTEDEKNKVRADALRNVKSAAIVGIIAVAIIIAYAHHHSEYMKTMMNLR